MPTDVRLGIVLASPPDVASDGLPNTGGIVSLPLEVLVPAYVHKNALQMDVVGGPSHNHLRLYLE